MVNTNSFLLNKINEIKNELSQLNQNHDLFELIGSVRDVFSSAYLTNSIADSVVVSDLWQALLAVFLYSEVYSNKFESILTMSYISLYAKQNNISLNLAELKKWRTEQVSKNISLELLECVDDIFLNE